MSAPAPQAAPVRAAAADDDSVLPFQIDALGARGRIVRLAATVDTVLHRHDYPDPVAALLGEAMALGAALASSLKYDGVFTLQIKGDGPVRLLVVDLTTAGVLRGYAQFDAAAVAAATAGAAADPSNGLPDNPIARLCGSGSMAFTVDQGPDMERYQGVVALEGATLGDCAHHYFRQSEQLRTGIKLAVGRAVDGAGRRGWRAAALMVQQLPTAKLWDEIDAEERDEFWRRAVVLMGSARAAEMVDASLPADRLLHRLFHEDGVRAFAPRALSDGCRCSRARIDGVLRGIPRGELDELRDGRGMVSVTCEFCSSVYDYDAAAIAALFEAD